MLFRSSKAICYIDGVPTIITSHRGNLAKGFIVDLGDFSKRKTYVAKNGTIYAHGDTAQLASEALRDKLLAQMSEEERIGEFVSAKFTLGKRYAVSVFFDWHGRLTGSCQSGREAFARQHNLDVKNGKMTLAEFFRLTESAYGGETIKKLKKHYKVQ